MNFHWLSSGKNVYFIVSGMVCEIGPKLVRGHKAKTKRPLIIVDGTGPYTRESVELPTLSPIKKYWLLGTVMFKGSPYLLLRGKLTSSPGQPTTRLQTNYCGADGLWHITISPGNIFPLRIDHWSTNANVPSSRKAGTILGPTHNVRLATLSCISLHAQKNAIHSIDWWSKLA